MITRILRQNNKFQVHHTRNHAKARFFKFRKQINYTRVGCFFFVSNCCRQRTHKKNIFLEKKEKKHEFTCDIALSSYTVHIIIYYKTQSTLSAVCVYKINNTTAAAGLYTIRLQQQHPSCSSRKNLLIYIYVYECTQYNMQYDLN